MRFIAKVTLFLFAVAFGLVLLAAAIEALGLGPWQPYSPFYSPEFFHARSPMYAEHVALVSRTATTSWLKFGVVLVLLPLLVVGGVIAAVVVLSRGSTKTNKPTVDEARIVQQIYEGLSQMEKRVETLETILLERSRKQEV